MKRACMKAASMGMKGDVNDTDDFGMKCQAVPPKNRKMLLCRFQARHSRQWRRLDRLGSRPAFVAQAFQGSFFSTDGLSSSSDCISILPMIGVASILLVS